MSLPMLMVAFMTLVQRRSPQAIMGRVSTAIEVVMATPQAVSLALGSALVVVLTYRQIYAIMCVVTLLAAAHIAFWLRGQIRDDLHAPHQAPDPDADMGSPVSAALPTLDV
jgi:preprotein translocase subunit SecY